MIYYQHIYGINIIIKISLSEPVWSGEVMLVIPIIRGVLKGDL